MNQRAYIHLEIVKADASGNDRTYVLEMPFGSTYQECYDVSVEFTNQIVELSKQADEQRKKAEEEKAAAEQKPEGEADGSKE